MSLATMAAWPEEPVSPVYQQLPQLQEPDWKTLRVGRVRRFWAQHDEWTQRLERARAAGRLGDLLVLAEEGPVAAFRAEAWIGAGSALRRSAQFLLALEYLDKGLAIEPHFTREQPLRSLGDPVGLHLPLECLVLASLHIGRPISA